MGGLISQCGVLLTTFACCKMGKNVICELILVSLVFIDRLQGRSLASKGNLSAMSLGRWGGARARSGEEQIASHSKHKGKAT